MAGDVDSGDVLHYALVPGSVLVDGVAAPDGTVTVAADGSYGYVPPDAAQALAQGETRTITFGFVANDGLLDSGARTATITVRGVNDAPMARPDAAGAREDGAIVTGSVATNDSDVDHNATRTFALDAPVAGLTLATDGS